MQEQHNDRLIPQWIVPVLASLVATGLMVYVIIRNEPFKDSFSPQILRVMLGLLVAYALRELSGTIGWELSAGDQKIKATGQLAVFFVVFFAVYTGSPTVAPTLDPDKVRQSAPKVIATRSWTPRDYFSDLGAFYDDSADDISHTWIYHFGQFVQQDTTFKHRTVISETARFEHPFDSFNAVIKTIPTRTKNDTHIVLPFLVHSTRTPRTFTPLKTFTSFHNSGHQTVVHVPDTENGDYLFFFLLLNSDEEIFDGSTFNLQLHRI